ncbi:putative short-chain dehydrogenase/reductase family protein [Stachybotrys elegans]|uniref:Short-chain dehydrogenase/reductase family protein n=1 Tax=Stachybotrys elegans TaxID=80388 RepID=A0A8K0WKX4_9HYPO|nr:putative short-chain dehydrogenase/reductase family protein [Stachybotrys elegans]
MDYSFDISPEKEASVGQFLHRQFFVTPAAITSREVNLAGKTAIVTGSNTGIGLECAKQLLKLGISRLILAVRDESKGGAAQKNLARTAKEANIEVWTLDLSSYNSVTQFALRTQGLDRLDIVILNAGVWRQGEYFNQQTGVEETIQVNYLSNMLLAILLLPVLRSKNNSETPGRLVLVSSDTAALSKFSERDTAPLLSYYKKPSNKPDMFQRYATSKLLGQLSMSQLTSRVPPSAAILTLANPGLCHGSGLQRDAKGPAGLATKIAERIVGRTCEIGARTIVDAAVRHGKEAHGHYLENYKIRPMAPIIYKEDGQRIAASLWDELMKELAFAGAEEIIQSLDQQPPHDP